MARRTTLFAIIAALIVVGAGALWLTARRVAPERPLAPAVAADLQVKFERIIVRGRAGADRRWEMEASAVEVTRDQRLTRLEGLRKAVLYAGGETLLTASAAWARLESPSRDLELGGGVELASPGGLVLRTESLRWRADQERLDSQHPVTMTMGDTTVTAPRAHYLAHAQQIVCEGGVDIRQGENYLRGQRLTADLAAESLEIAGAVTMRLQVAEGREFDRPPGPLEAMQGLLEKAPREVR